MLAEALQAYEHTKAAYLRDRFIAEAEQARGGELLAAMAATEQAAQDLLAKAGLAHIAAAPLQLGEAVAPARRADEAVADAFSAAHTAYVDLRTSLCRLAEVQLTEQKWDDARRTLALLLADPKAPLAAYAHELLCESHYRPGKQALEVGQWEVARVQFDLALKEQAGYRDTDGLLREAYLRPARQALEAKQWEAVRQHAEPWLARHKDDKEARELVCESHYRPGKQALEAGQWDAARQYIEPWLKQYKEDKAAHELLCESYYRPGKQALETGKPEVALLQFLALAEREQGFRDAPELLKRAYQSLPKKMHPKISGLEFVMIPAGEFRYGEDKKKIRMDEFWISRTPITNAQYQAFVKTTGYSAPSHWSNGQIPKGKEQHPVVNVSWEDAQKFCSWAGVRLPGERQWEKAARGSDGRTYPWGEAAPDSRRCNFNNQVGDTTPVGSYPEGASPYGLQDMAGNVWEWCEDAYDSSSRVLRGGAFDLNGYLVRCAARDRSDPFDRGRDNGFRVVAPSL